MLNRTGFSGVLLAGVLVGSASLILCAAERSKAGGTATSKAGDINVINSHVVIGGNMVAGTDSGLVVGNGRRVTRSVPVAADFHGLDLSGLFKTEVVCGPAASVAVVIDENLQPLLTASVKEGVLSLRFTKPVQTKKSPQLKITLPLLDILLMSGGDEVRVADVKGKSLRLNHEGTGAVTLAGKVDDFSCTVSGIGEVDASRLACSSAEIAISGVGGVTCRPNAKLTASLSGIGGIRCLTHPAKVEKQATGIGDVEFVEK
jgi:hypothetical protein